MPRPPAPKIDHPYVFSVSQVETFVLCARKWALDKIDGLERPSTDAAALGGRIHDVLELYLAKAVKPDTDTVEGRIVLPGLEDLPIPRTPGMRIEKWFAIVFGSAAYRGLKDVEILSGRKFPLVLDHKSTKDWRWKKTEEELVEDIQAGIYSADAMAKTKADYVDLQWQYYRTTGAAKSEPVRARISRIQVGDILTRTNHHAEEMIRTLKMYRRGEAIKVTPDFTGCSKYGGCQYRDSKCKPKPVQVLKSIMAQKTEEKKRSTKSFLETMRARKKKTGASGGSKEVTVDDVDTIDTEDKVNPPDRDSAEQPAPPPPKKIGDVWVQAEWDEDDFEWKYPEAALEAEAAAAKATKKKAAKTAKTAVAKGARNSKSVVDRVKARKEEVEDLDSEEEESAEEEEETPSSEDSIAADSDVLAALNVLLGLIAELVEKRMKKKSRG